MSDNKASRRPNSRLSPVGLCDCIQVKPSPAGTLAFFFSQILNSIKTKMESTKKERSKPTEWKRSKSRGVDDSDRQTWQQWDPLLLEKTPYLIQYTPPYPLQTHCNISVLYTTSIKLSVKCTRCCMRPVWASLIQKHHFSIKRPVGEVRKSIITFAWKCYIH